MKIRTFQVDAFADAPFTGNPAAVCLLDEPLADATMQAIAAEMNLSETAFIGPPCDDLRTPLPLRWFTPGAEVDLCGHATLASAATVFALDPSVRDVAFDTRSGRLTVERTDDGALTMVLPASQLADAEPPPGLLEALGVDGRPIIRRTKFDLLLELPDADAVRRLTPDLRALRTVDVRGVMVTAAADAGDDVDFVSRFFAPRVGVDEDPVTGSAHCALAPWWCDRLGRSEVRGRQVSQRSGVVSCVWDGGPTVALTGRTVIVLAGDLIVPD